MRHKVDGYIATPVPLLYTDLPPSSRRAHRQQVRQQVMARQAQDEALAAPHAARLEAFIQSGAVGVLLFDADLPREVRATIHDLAEQLGLEHESRGMEPNRQLQVWLSDDY